MMSSNQFEKVDEGIFEMINKFFESRFMRLIGASFRKADNTVMVRVSLEGRDTYGKGKEQNQRVNEALRVPFMEEVGSKINAKELIINTRPR